jgi:hypothetical protein
MGGGGCGECGGGGGSSGDWTIASSVKELKKQPMVGTAVTDWDNGESRSYPEKAPL